MNKKLLTAMMIVLLCVRFILVPVQGTQIAERSVYRAFIDYTPIDSYIIDGYTYIDAVELVNYGFDVVYSTEMSSLNITRIRYATPIYSKNAWKKSTLEKRSSTVENSDIEVYLDGILTDSFRVDGKTLIMIDSLAQYGEFAWSDGDKTVSITIFQHELKEELERADNIVELEYKYGLYKGQVNEKNEPYGIGILEFVYSPLSKIKYLGYFSNGKPDGLVYKETFHTVSKSYVYRYTHFIGEIDGSKESKREVIRDYNIPAITMIRDPNFGTIILPIKEIPEWTGPETNPDTTVYKKGCYYERWYGREGQHEYRIWSDDRSVQTIVDTCLPGADSFYADRMDGVLLKLKEENNAAKYITEFYEYNNDELSFRDGYIHTATGTPLVLNSLDHGAGQIMPQISILINGEEMEFKTDPVIENDHVLVPMRAIFEELGAEVLWDEETQSVIAVKEEREVSLQIKSKNMYINNKLFVLDVEPIIVNETTMIPVRAVSEAFSADVNWNGDTKTVDILVP